MNKALCTEVAGNGMLTVSKDGDRGQTDSKRCNIGAVIKKLRAVSQIRKKGMMPKFYFT